MKTEDLFLENASIAYSFIKEYEYPYMVLPDLKEYILKLGKDLSSEYVEVKEHVWVHKTAKIASSAYLVGPCIIDEGAEVRHCAFIRGSVIIGKNSVLGNSCEIKNSILFDSVQVPHFNYVGDSILGYHAHMGAGSITSNVKSDKKNVTIMIEQERIETNLKKIGAFLGDYVEVGCNAVLNPGTMIGPNSIIYPLTSVRGTILSNKIVKDMNCIVDRINL